MTLPPALQTGIDELIRGIDAQELERSSRALSNAYRAGGTEASRAAGTADAVSAYLATRAPATYAAAADVLGRIRALRLDWRPTSLLDLGAGPGIATWAAIATWPEVEEATLLEVEPAMAAAGRTLAKGGTPAMRAATWVDGELGAMPQQADLVLVSYALGELGETARPDAVRHAWHSTLDTLVIVEPGTTAGYRNTLLARDVVTAVGGSTLAPCPHDLPCPLPEGDWCHFSARLPRSRTHRLAKDAERGFEDEKYAYTVLTRAPHVRAGSRVLRRPDLRKGHVVVELCTPSGLERRTVSRRDGDTYRAAKKVEWGDTLADG